MPFPPIRIPIVSVEDHDSSLAQSGLFPFFGAFPSLHSTGWTALPYWHVTAICDATLSVFLLAPSLCSVPSSPPVFVPKRGISQRSAQKVQRDNRRPVYQPCSVRVSERAFCAGSFFWPFLRKKGRIVHSTSFTRRQSLQACFYPFPKIQHSIVSQFLCPLRSAHGDLAMVIALLSRSSFFVSHLPATFYISFYMSLSYSVFVRRTLHLVRNCSILNNM